MEHATQPKSAPVKLVLGVIFTLVLQACATDALVKRPNKVTMFIDITDASAIPDFVCPYRVALIRPKVQGNGRCKGPNENKCKGKTDCYCFPGVSDITWKARYLGSSNATFDKNFQLSFTGLPAPVLGACTNRVIRLNEGYKSTKAKLTCGFEPNSNATTTDEYVYEVALKACPEQGYDPTIIVSPE